VYLTNLNSEKSSTVPSTYKSGEAGICGRVFSHVNGANLIDAAAWIFNPGSAKANDTLCNLENLAAGDKCLVPLINDIVQYLLKKTACPSDPIAFPESGETAAGYYLKHFIGSLFLVLGREILEDRKEEAFACAQDMLMAVIGKIRSQFTEQLDSVKTLTDDEIYNHVENIIDYFFDKVKGSETSWSLKIALTMAKCFLKKNFVAAISHYYSSYADIARQADQIRGDPQFQEMEPSVQKLNFFIGYQLEKQLHGFPAYFKTLFGSRKSETWNQQLLADVFEGCIIEFFSENKGFVNDIETFLMARFIGLGDGKGSVRQRAADIMNEFMFILYEEVEEEGYAIRTLRDLMLNAEKSKEELYKLKNGIAAFMLQNRIKLLNQELQICQKEEKNLIKVELQRAAMQMNRLGEKVSDDDIERMLHPVIDGKEADWSLEYGLACRSEKPQDLYDLSLAIVMAPGANRMIDKVLEERFKSNKMLEGYKLQWGLKLASQYLGRLAHDRQFYNSELKPELAQAVNHLTWMPNGKGAFLIELIQQSVDFVLDLENIEERSNPVLLGAVSPIVAFNNHAMKREKPIKEIVCSLFIILTSKVLKSEEIPGSDLDEKVESLFKRISDIIDDVFKDYETFLSFTDSEKASAVTREIQKSAKIKYYWRLQKEKGLEGEELYKKTYKYCSELQMSRKIIELMFSEKTLMGLLPTVAQDISVYDGVICSLQSKIRFHFDTFYRIYLNLRNQSFDQHINSDQEKLESFLCDYTLHRMNMYAESLQEAPYTDNLCMVTLFSHLFTKGGIKAAVEKIQNTKNSPCVIGESTVGAVRKLSHDLTQAFPPFWDDPNFFSNMLHSTSRLAADYLDNGISAADRLRFGDQAGFLDDYTMKILRRIYPNGAAGLPLPECLQEASWEKKRIFLRESIKNVLDYIEDENQRKILILNLLAGKKISPAPSGAQLNQMIEQCAVERVLESVKLQIPGFLKHRYISFLLAPFIWLLQTILIKRVVRSVKKLLTVTDSEEFSVFLRKLVWQLTEEILSQNEGLEVADFQKNVSRIADGLDVPFFVSRFAAAKMSPRALIANNETILQILMKKQLA
jgi:hypothetical protein